MWRAYFGERSCVYGVDIQPECRVYEGPGKRIFIGDQADPAFWSEFLREVPEVDIVIDDGGHQPDQQIATFKALFPHIRPGGVYLCEDIVGEFNPFFDYLNGVSRGLQTYRARRRGGAAQRGSDPLPTSRRLLPPLPLGSRSGKAGGATRQNDLPDRGRRVAGVPQHEELHPVCQGRELTL